MSNYNRLKRDYGITRIMAYKLYFSTLYSRYISSYIWKFRLKYYEYIEKLRNKYYGHIKYPEICVHLLHKYTGKFRESYGMNPIIIHLNGKDAVLVKKEWRKYVDEYIKVTKKLNPFLKFILNSKKPDSEFNIKTCSIIYNENNLVDKSSIIILGGNLRRKIEKCGNEITGNDLSEILERNDEESEYMTQISFYLTDEKEDDKIYEFDLSEYVQKK